jgi:DNA-binding NarL/FixJ family response regulator
VGAFSHKLFARNTSFAYYPITLTREERMPINRTVRILLVEEARLIRAAIQKLLESWPEFEVVGEADSRENAIELLRRLDPDVIVLALAGDGSEDLETVRELSQAAERPQLLVLIGDVVASVAAEIVSLGARGVVRKNKAPDELRLAIQKVYEGKEIWLDRVSLSILVSNTVSRRRNSTSSFDPLTVREREVVRLVTAGLKNREVGEKLFISETTVRHHLTAVFDKLKIRNRFDLINYVHRQRDSVERTEQVNYPPQEKPDGEAQIEEASNKGE